MITRDIHEVAEELTNMVIREIYQIAKKRQEDEIQIGLMFHNTLFESLSVYFPDDDEELTDEEYLDEMDIEVSSQYTDNEDGLIYEYVNDITDLDLSTLLEIHKIISK